MPSRPARNPTQCPISRSEFARRAGRAPASITEACRVGGPLEAACLPGGRLDAISPAAVAWATKRGIDPASLLDPVTAASVPSIEVPGAIDVGPGAPATSMRGRGRPKAGAKPANASDTDYSQPRDITDLLQCTLLELTTRHGSAQGFADWLDTRKQIAETARLESRNDRDAGRLISAELVGVHVFGMIDGQNRRLLNNAPRTIAVRALSLARNGGTLEELTTLASSAISTELRVTVAKARRAIGACKTGDNPPPVSPPAEARAEGELHEFSRGLKARLRAEAVPIVLDLLMKQIVHAASGERWDRALAEAAMATKPALLPEAARVIGNILDAHVSNAVTEAITQEHKS